MPDITIKLDQDKFNSLLVNGAFLDVSYEIKDVAINDDLFKNDTIHEQLKKASIKAYKDLKIYEFNKRTKHK